MSDEPALTPTAEPADASLYRALVDALDEGYCIIEMLYDGAGRPIDYRFIETNPVFDAQTGLSGTIGRSVRELVPAHEPHWFEIYGEVARTGEARRFQQEASALGRWFDVYAYRIGGPGSDRVGVLFRDITGQRDAERRLRDSEQRLRLAAIGADAGTFIHDVANDRVDIDATVTRLLGLRDRPARGMPLDSLIESIVPEDRAAAGELLGRSIAACGEFRAEFRVSQPDGGVRWIECRGRVECDAGGAPVRMPGILIDVTERHRVQQALRDSESRIQLAAEIAQLGSWRYEPGADAVQLDERMRRLWGEPPGQAALPFAQALGRVHREDRPRVDAAIRAALDPSPDAPAGGRYQMDCRIRWADGSERWIAANGLAQFEGEGAARVAVQLIGTALDVTERKRIEAELRDADLRKNEFLAVLAHELRNPLAPIRNALQLLQRGGGRIDTGRVREMLDRQVSHMVRLIDDLMEASRISRGVIELQRAPIDIAAVLHGVIEAARTTIEQAGLRLAIGLPGEPLPVHGDAVRLGQVFANLLGNAARYTDAGGLVEIRAWRDGAEACVAVADSGIGIAAEQLERIFLMFNQVDRQDPRSQGGLGIGLALAQRLARMHGGEIEVHSAGLGRGSRFTVRLPLDESALAAKAEAAPQAAAAPASRRVLVVDDNRDAADSTGELVSVLGGEVRVVHDGADALELLDRWRPHVVLLDLGMPGLDGYEVARRIRSLPGGEAIELVALTGWGDAADRRRTAEAGFQRHLVKPVDVRTLIELIGAA